MSSNRSSFLDRRSFLRQTSLAAAAGISTKAFAATGSGVSLIVDPADTIASAAPARTALAELERALQAKGLAVHRYAALADAPQADFCLVAAGVFTPLARSILKSARAKMPQAPESLALIPGRAQGREVLLACGSDARGLSYAVRELADQVNLGGLSLTALHGREAAVVESPQNRVRSVNRAFVGSVEDLPWFHDRSMWPAYFSMLAAQRFNRFNLTLGLGYDYPNPVFECYLHFAYPFLVKVPGYDVRALHGHFATPPEGGQAVAVAGSGPVTLLSDQERDLNLEMLRFISDQAAAHGLDFQLGLWNHGYIPPRRSHPDYIFEGLTPENHAPYCRDALLAILRACPNINGVTIRVHGESGIPEPGYDFWRTLFTAIPRSGRTVEVNLHAKGMSEEMIDIALATKMPVTLSPKYWAEHHGLSYQPASIRQMEMPPRHQVKKGFFDLSEGSRRFLRYSYGDLFKKNRRYGIFFRIFPGTQRALLWGDPVMAAGDSRAMTFCGCDGVDFFEPLSFKGRHGSGLLGGRCAYQDESLNPHFDWQKFLYTYRVWGRSLYNPSTDPEGWRRLLRHQLGQAAAPAAEALAHATRILRLVTTAHDPSAANNLYWPEIYTNMPIVDAALNHVYFDTLPPRIYNNVSPLDPELFSQINEFTQNRLKGKTDGKYSPLDVAGWLELMAKEASRHLAEARKRSHNVDAPEFRRLAVDVTIQAALGRFYAWKMRSGVLFELFQQTGHREVLEYALGAYRRARTHWLEAAQAANGVYRTDITYGRERNLRGNWFDRLDALDHDIDAMEDLLVRPARPFSSATLPPAAAALLSEAARPGRPLHIDCRHTPRPSFQPGQPLPVTLSVASAARAGITSVLLNYRRVDQGLYYEQAEMKFDNGYYSAVIPGAYTSSPYPLQYFFILYKGPATAAQYPGLAPLLSHQPYFVVRQA